MVGFNMLWKLCVVVAFGLSATVTATDVAQEQPKKESFVSRFFGKGEEPSTEPVEVTEPTKSETDEPPMYSVEWYLFPKLENRKHLRYRLPYDLAKFLPRNCNKPIKPRLEKLIRKFFSESLQKQETMRRHFILPLYLKAKLGRS